MKLPKAVIFDMGDTILRVESWDPRTGNEHLLELAAEIGDVTIDQVMQRADLILRDLRPRREASGFEFPTVAFNRLLFESLGVVFDRSHEHLAAEFWRVASNFTVEPGIADVLDELERRGIRRGIVSNASFSGEILTEELTRFGLIDRFEFLMSSVDYALRKPHPLMLEIACRKLEVEPGDAWYVGDRPDFDVAGAHAAGMVGVLYDQKQYPRDGVEPDAVCSDWPSFIQLLSTCE